MATTERREVDAAAVVPSGAVAEALAKNEVGGQTVPSKSLTHLGALALARRFDPVNGRVHACHTELRLRIGGRGTQWNRSSRGPSCAQQSVQGQQLLREDGQPQSNRQKENDDGDRENLARNGVIKGGRDLPLAVLDGMQLFVQD